jgi:hypothetical protein
MTQHHQLHLQQPLNKGKQHRGAHNITIKKTLQDIIPSHLTLISFLPTSFFFPRAYHLPHYIFSPFCVLSFFIELAPLP